LVQLQGFFMSQTSITQAQWREVAGWKEGPGEQWGRELKLDPSRFQSNNDQHPVENVTWWEAMEFCHRLSKRTDRIYTLPSEAQWEYACRAGTITPFHFGDTISPELANYNGTHAYGDGPKGINREQTTPVGMFPANAWGLQDMHGNVWEWCLDEWHESYEGAPTDGRVWAEHVEGEKGKEREQTRLVRGGSWLNYPRGCRSAFRFHFRPDFAFLSVGFRVVCLPHGPSLNP
jgi:formylglycine-generating enzyme required for sulfatase activity